MSGSIESAGTLRTRQPEFAGVQPMHNPWSAAYPTANGRGRLGSHLVYGRVNKFHWSGSGNMSVKTVFSGHAEIDADGGKHRVEPSTYLVLNHGREYSFALDGRECVDGLSMFFEPEMVDGAIRSRRRTLERQLDEPYVRRRGAWEFFERIYPQDRVAAKLGQVHHGLQHFSKDPVWVQESLHITLDLIIDRHVEARQEVENVCAVRAVTKEELYRRLYKARDYAYATLHQSVSLDDLAYVACLSTNYFLRSFRGLFLQTPHQFIIEKRIERARSLLANTGDSVSDICLSVGFQSLGSFSWLFKKRTGLSPEAFRRSNAPCIR